MSNWRPEDWDMPIVEHLSTGEAFEVGADAMLEALRKGGAIVKDGELKNAVGLFFEDGIAKALNLNGKLIFIPDDTP